MLQRPIFAMVFGLVLTLFACEETAPVEQNTTPMSQPTADARDVHSYARPELARVTHLDLNLRIDWEQKVLNGQASYDLDVSEGTKELILDTRDLDIYSVTDGTDSLKFSLGQNDPSRGQALSIQLNDNTKRVTIAYQTRPNAAALQWLDPVQTAGKNYPFLFTQGQAILTRTWLPTQDGPGMRFTYAAEIETSIPELLVVMSAENPTEVKEAGKYTFRMEQPIPAYLMALAAGNLDFKAIGERTGVYAEPEMIEASANEFDEMDEMLALAEELYGPYRWERYDVIVLPPSFPFGGMENPRLTFATPTIIAGDRSLTSLIAHELAHSWSGNLVTNATWDDFWLNEGFTVYFERRIMEELYGESYAEMLETLGYQDLEGTLEELGPESADTHLKLAMEGRDPDEGMTDIAYEKGYFLLKHIEATVGREKFDAFLRKYFDDNAFKTMTTEQFVDYTEANLIAGDERLKEELSLGEWIYAPGLPASLKKPESARFTQVNAQVEDFSGGKAAGQLNTKDWTTHEWLHFIRHLPAEMDREEMAGLDKAFGFTQSGNSEIQAAWFMHVIANAYDPAYPALESFLKNVGRRKFLKPLYTEMAKTPEGLAMAREIYQEARPNYHSVSTGTIDVVLGLDS